MKIILIGIQGAGKSTQGNLLRDKLNIPYLSSGHILRNIAKEKTKEGRYIKETINAGVLVPDDKMTSIIEAYLSRKEYEEGYVLDGYPRTVEQAKTFREKIDKVIYLKVSDKEALWRLSYRNGEVREDETLLVIRKRIDLFHEFTEPVLEFYRRRGILIEIDGEKSVEDVRKEILQSLTP
ncbi:MAG: nucleoside monophosphate kinase [Patescibacteria group bacterium]